MTEHTQISNASLNRPNINSHKTSKVMQLGRQPTEHLPHIHTSARYPSHARQQNTVQFPPRSRTCLKTILQYHFVLGTDYSKLEANMTPCRWASSSPTFRPSVVPSPSGYFWTAWPWTRDTILRNAENSPNDRASYHIKLNTSVRPLWEPQISQGCLWSDRSHTWSISHRLTVEGPTPSSTDTQSEMQ
jgi:hypothetical protein